MQGAGLRLVTEFEAGPAMFVSEVGLDETGRLVATSPLRRFLGEGSRDLGVAFRVAWSLDAVVRYQREIDAVQSASAAEVAECRDFLAGLTPGEIDELIATLRNGVLSVPPVQLNRGRDVLSNLREETNLTGKTLSPHSPQCYFTDLARLPLPLWSDDEVVVIVSLWITYRSGGAHRIESLNGTHVDLERVWDNFLMIRSEYENSFVPVELPDLAPERPSVTAMLAAAEALNEARTILVTRRALAHRIKGATRAKREFALPEPTPLPQVAAVLDAVRGLIPASAACSTLAEVRDRLRGDPWLLAPAAGEPTGLEAIIATTVAAAVEAFDADYALSRGLREYPALVRAVKTGDFDEIIQSELPAYFCCVLPSRSFATDQKHTPAEVADLVWSMSARMQYNTWHVLPGNLPKEASEYPRDYFAPQVLPDIADNMHYFHRGHVVASIRHTLRSPEQVNVAGRPFNSLADLRLLRVDDRPFTTTELAAVVTVARFIADCFEEYATRCVAADAPTITSFDSAWHRLRIVQIGDLS